MDERGGKQCHRGLYSSIIMAVSGSNSPQDLDQRGGGINSKEGRGGCLSKTKRILNRNRTEEGVVGKIS